MQEKINILILTVAISLSVWDVNSLESGKCEIGKEKYGEGLTLLGSLVASKEEISKLKAFPQLTMDLDKWVLKETKVGLENQPIMLNKKFKQNILQVPQTHGTKNVISVLNGVELKAEESQKIPDEDKPKIREPRSKRRKCKSCRRGRGGGGRRRGGHRRRH